MRTHALVYYDGRVVAIENMGSSLKGDRVCKVSFSPSRSYEGEECALDMTWNDVVLQ